MWIRIKSILVSTVLILAAVSPISLILSSKVSAVSASDWQAGRIIDDEIFFNPNAMTDQDIQTFLNSKVPVCNAQPGNPPCIKNYSQSIPTIPADAYCSTIYGGSNLSAASIIKIVTQACSMNPAAMLVLIQKEQSLITSEAPTSYKYQFATGFCVYDTVAPPACAGTDGFFNQIYYAARQFQKYASNPNGYNFAIGRTSNIQYSPNTSCGSAPVLIQTKATAGLYNYTPYQPNQDTLNAGWGEAPCGAYGNRNFWRYFWIWFGSPLANKPVSNVGWTFENLEGGTTGIKTTTNTVGITPTTISYKDKLYVFYYDSTQRVLKTAVADSNGWSYETLDGDSTVNGRVNGDVGKATSAFIYDDMLHIFYYDATNMGLRHAWYHPANGWVFEDVDGTTGSISNNVANVGMSNMAVAYADGMHAFYYDATNANLRHGWYTPTNGWKFENLEGDYGSVSGINGVIGQNPEALVYGGSIQLFYYDVSGGNLRHAWSSPTQAWKFENLDGDLGSVSRSDGNVGQDPSITIHGGTFQLFYYDVSKGNLRHAWASASRGWKFENLEGDVGSVSGYNTNIGSMPRVISFKNNLYVFYRENSAGLARYAWADSSGWHFANLEGTAYSVSGLTSNTGFWPSVASYGDNLQLYYFDNGQRALRHVFGTPYW